MSMKGTGISPLFPEHFQVMDGISPAIKRNINIGYGPAVAVDPVEHLVHVICHNIGQSGTRAEENYQNTQQGKTDYLTVCRQAAEAGVEKWIVDLEKMTCTYYDKAGNSLLVEIIPTP